MISFIVIGRNEGWKLTKCLDSVYHAIQENNLDSYEVIYVDSQSTDDSINRAKFYKDIRIFRITGHYNAAIARNIGAKEAKGDLLCFLDGDLELQAPFLENIKGFDFNRFILTGELIEYYYNLNWEYIGEKHIGLGDNNEVGPISGGYFIISKKNWNLVGGMKNHMKNAQDPDIGLRLAKKGLLRIRLNKPIAIHHTISRDLNKMLRGGYIFKRNPYGIILIRENLNNRFVFKRVITREKTLFILLFSIALSFLHPLFLILYLIGVLFRSLKKSHSSIYSFVNHYLHYFLRDITFFFFFFFFWPKKQIKVEYTQV